MISTEAMAAIWRLVATEEERVIDSLRTMTPAEARTVLDLEASTFRRQSVMTAASAGGRKRVIIRSSL